MDTYMFLVDLSVLSDLNTVLTGPLLTVIQIPL